MANRRKLYRAVTKVEFDDICSHAGRFRDSKHLSGEKGFFYDLESARKFAAEAEKAFGERHVIVSTEADAGAFDGSREHDVAREGRGVYLRVSKLHLLAPAVEVKS